MTDLLRRVAQAIDPTILPTDLNVYGPEARFAIRAVADWLKEQGHRSVAQELYKQADIKL